MMAQATPTPSSLNSEFIFQFKLPLLRSHVNLHNRPRTRNRSPSSNAWGRRDRVLIVVRAAYTRSPLETAGAYQLVDDETGEKFIVWGGADGEESRSEIPPEEVLRWKPSKNNFGGAAPVDSIDKCSNGNDSVAASRGGGLAGKESARSFGRLKVRRVRDLSTSSSPNNQRRSVRGGSPAMDRTNLSIFSLSGENREMVKTLKKLDDTDQHMMPNKHKVEQVFDYQATQPKLPDRGSSSSSSTASPGFVGWSNEDNFRSKRVDLSKRRRKLDAASDFFSTKSFEDLGCCDDLIKFLRNQHFPRPSHIQAMAFEPVTDKKSCIIADQSGSGKTLAYLLPLIQRIRQEELQGRGKSLSQNPRIVVLVPTAELGSQVLSNCRLLAKYGVPFRSMVATGGFRQRTQLENLRQELDVLIATPGRFMFLVNEGFLKLTNLICAVLDEVDILFNDEDFEPALQILVSSSPVTTQYLFVTATLPVNIYNMLVENFPDCEVVMGPGMHRTSPGLEEILVDCSGADGTEKTPETAFQNKKAALLQIVNESPNSKMIIFCNKIETCRKVENVLKRFDRNGSRARVFAFHAALDQGSRVANMEEFCRAQPGDRSLFLVCTDRASRGIDFVGVDRVALFDFPRDPSEYVRRVGRTARGAGGKGKAFVFVVGKQVSLARRIIERNMKGHPLHDVPLVY